MIGLDDPPDHRRIPAPVDPTTPGRRHWVVLADSRRPESSREPTSLRRMVVVTAIAAVAVAALVGLVGSLLARHTAENEAVHNVAQLTDVLARSVVQPALTDAMATSPQRATRVLDPIVRQNVVDASLVRVKLWNADGTVLYSNDPRLIGQRFPLDVDARSALTLAAHRGRDLGPATAGEPARPRPGQAARGVPAGVDAGRHAAAVRDLLQVRQRGRPQPRTVARVRRDHPDQHRRADAAARPARLGAGQPDAAGPRRARPGRRLGVGGVRRGAPAHRRHAARRRRAATGRHVVRRGRRGAPGGEQRRRPNSAAGWAGWPARSATRIAGLRSLLVDIYPPSLHSSGLAAALRDLARSSTGSGATVDVDIDAEAADALPSDAQESTFRVVQEALRNAVRHSQADAGHDRARRRRLRARRW